MSVPIDLTDVFSWSHSSMSTYDTCPRQFKGKYVQKKFPYEQSAEAKFGDAVHNALETRGKTGAPMPTGMEQYASYLDAVARRPGTKLYENAFALRVDGVPCGYFDKQNGKSIVWVRAKIDVINLRYDLRRAEVFDWKTGKVKNDPAQLVMYAMMVFLHFPEIDEVRAGYCWLATPLQQAFTAPTTFYRHQLPELLAHYRRKYENVKHSVETDHFPENPSGLCNGWCPDKECKFWRPKRS